MRRLKRIVLLSLVAALLSACTPEEVQTYLGLGDDAQRAVVEHVVRDAAERWDVDPELMLEIVRCESGFDPTAVNRTSGALGLGQHLPQYWPARAEALGLDPAQWADPRVNAEVTAWMLSTQGTAPWYPSRGCWS